MLMRTTVIVAALMLVGIASAIPVRADKLTEANMTKDDYDRLTKTEASDPGERPVPVVKIHDLSDAKEDAVKAGHGVKVIKGKEWKASSPKERDKLLRALTKDLKPGAIMAVEIPSGNVWAIDLEEFEKLKKDKDVRTWKPEEVEKIPATVKRDPANPQENRRNGDPFRDLGLDFRF